MSTFTTTTPIGTCPRITAEEAATLVEDELHRNGMSLAAFGYGPAGVAHRDPAAEADFAGSLECMEIGSETIIGEVRVERVS